MNAALFKRLESAFDEAWSLAAMERSAYVQNLGRVDRELASRLMELLALDTREVDGRVRASLERATITTGGEKGTSAGPYRLLGIIAEGGFGVVHLAEQPAPVHRLVAVKVIKPGMDSRQVLERFNDERQALALMDHPTVVAAIDAGTTTEGRPFVVMPLVPGLPIAGYCRDRGLSVAERCRLLIEVCRGVQLCMPII